MKDSLNHLPQRKRGELARIVSIIREMAPKTKTHKLDKLGKMAAQHDPAFFEIFPLGAEEEKRRFDLLKRAYVEARYNPKYIITPQELKYLARCTQILRDKTQTSCETKMKSWSETYEEFTKSSTHKE